MSVELTQPETETGQELYSHHRKVDPESECPDCGKPFYRKFKAPWFHDDEYVYEHMVHDPDFGDGTYPAYTKEKCTH